MRMPNVAFRNTALIAAVAVLASVALAQQPAPVQAPTQGNLQPVTREAQALPSLAPLVESVKSAVVNVDVTARAGAGMRGGLDQNPFDRFFGGPSAPGGREQLRQGAGSGFIVDPKGLVLTNNHVIEGATSILVKLDDGRSFSADVVGRDPLTDVALLKLKGKVENLPSVGLGNSDDTRVGDWLVAIGNPFGLASSVSLGILSAKARDIHAGPYDDFLQTDAAINPGNSGGPLFNMKGEVVGINTAIVGGGSGIGFAVPSNLIKALLPQLEKEGIVTRGYLGIGIQDLTADIASALKMNITDGAIVNEVRAGGPGSKAGLKVDDIIVAIDGQKIGTGSALTRTVALKRPGSTSTLTIFRNGTKQDVKVTLGTRPDLEGIGKNTPREEEEESSKARVGISLSDLDGRTARQAGFSEDQGALVTDVMPGSPADRADLAPGMLVVEANRKPVRSARELAGVIKSTPSGGTLLLRVMAPGGSSKLLRALRVP
jgi:serine protease Do